MTEPTPDNSGVSYRYFNLGLITPVRVKFNDAGHKINAEVPDPETQDLRMQPTLMSRLEKSPDTTEIDKETFDQMCKDIYAGKKGNGWDLRFPA